MADKIPEVLADLPEDWGYEQIVAPEGESVGLTPQHGYNYLMKKVNECARTLNRIVAEMGQIAPDDMVTAKGGGQLILPGVLGDGPYVITFTEEETAEYALKSDLSKYAPKASPIFSGSITLGTRRSSIPVGENSLSAGTNNSSSGIGTVAIGVWASATGSQSLAVGSMVAASGNFSVAAGNRTEASGDCSHAEGNETTASGYASHAEGSGSTASGMYSHAEGLSTTAAGTASYAAGNQTTANSYQYVIGTHNVERPGGDVANGGDRFIVGGGTSNGGSFNAFRVHSDGSVYGGQYHASGADYAEIYEWADGNPEAGDRVGCFVCLDGEKIRFAGPEDHISDVLGIVSAAPSIVGDSHDDQWRDMYLRDIFGRPLYEDVEVEDPANPGKMVMARRRKLNPAYDHTQEYIPQSRRPEKAAVGLLGKLVVIDDGTCEANGWACPGPGGIATRSETRNRFRVMSRIDGTHIRVNIMVQ